MADKKRIAVVFGGQSFEHEVSKISARFVIENIDRNRYDVVIIGITREGKWLSYNGPVEKITSEEWQSIAQKNAALPSVTSACISSARDILKTCNAEGTNRKIDVVFPVLHGCNGEDGTIQGLFELSGVPYVGCGVLSSALGMDKGFSKIVFEKEGIPQGRYIVISRKQIQKDIELSVKQIEDVLEYPCFVKPCNAGSSVGVSKAHDRDQLAAGLETASRYDRRVLVEEFINGREVECAVLGNDEPIASTVGEVVPGNEFYDYNAKYLDDNSSIIIPANLPEETIQIIRDYAVKAFRALDCAGLSRVDFFVHKETGKVYINEINTIPGFTSISMYPKLWEASGISYKELINRLVELALERHQDKEREI